MKKSILILLGIVLSFTSFGQTTPDLMQVTDQGNDAGANQIKNIADATDPQDAVAFNQLPSTSNFVPYTGATANLDLGGFDFSTTGTWNGLTIIPNTGTLDIQTFTITATGDCSIEGTNTGDITLTTIGTSGLATLVGQVLNVPDYTSTPDGNGIYDGSGTSPSSTVVTMTDNITFQDATNILVRVQPHSAGVGKVNMYNGGVRKIGISAGGESVFFNNGQPHLIGINTTVNNYALEVSGLGTSTGNVAAFYGSTGTVFWAFSGNAGGSGSEIIGTEPNGTTRWLRFRSNNHSYFNKELMLGTVNDLNAAVGIEGEGSSSATTALHIQNLATATLFHVENGGNIGIGTSTPDAHLEISSASTIKTAHQITNTSTNGVSWELASLGSGVAGRVGNLQIQNASTSLNILAITPLGSIGMGTTTPDHLLDIEGAVNGTTAAQLSISGTGVYPNNISGILLDAGGAVQSNIRFAESGVLKFQIRYNAGNVNDKKLKFYSFITASDIVTFDAVTGDVGIGTTTPTRKLEVAGNVKVDETIIFGSSENILTDTTISLSVAEILALNTTPKQCFSGRSGYYIRVVKATVSYNFVSAYASFFDLRLQTATSNSGQSWVTVLNSTVNTTRTFGALSPPTSATGTQLIDNQDLEVLAFGGDPITGTSTATLYITIEYVKN